MGGDKGPSVVVDGVIDALASFKNGSASTDIGQSFLIVGDKNLIDRRLAERGASKNSRERDLPAAISVMHADDVITMNDSPVEAVREKSRSSLVLAAREVKEGRASALISPGNTGAVLAAGTLLLGRIRGVERPGIATVLPTAKGYSVLIDVGANVDSRATHLLQFGIMGSIYAQAILGIAEPRVGLLSIGEERTKGNELTREAFPLFEKLFSTMDQHSAGMDRHTAGSANHGTFLGNVEGRDIVNGKADVIVCDGFVGNVVLKFGEGLAFTFIDLIRDRIMASALRRIGGGLLKGAFAEFKKKIDYTEYGGAPLLGVKQPCIICHGSSGAKAIKNAIRVTRESLEAGICEKIETMIKSFAVDALARPAVAELPQREREAGGSRPRGSAPLEVA